MTHKEAIKNLTELQIRLINDNSEEAIEYNKKIHDTIAYFITQTIPLSVIGKITQTMEVEYETADELADDRLGGGYEKKASFYRGKASGITWVKGIIDKAVKECTHDKGLAISQSQIANAETINAITLNNIVELPKDEVAYGYISKQFPTTNVFFDSYKTALNSAIKDQPKHRPFYMIKATRHFEFCGIVENAQESEDRDDNS